MPPMKRLTLLLDDDALYRAVESQARTTGRTVDEIVVDALRQWRDDSQPADAERAELAAARREWAQRGGIEARAFFDTLRDEEARLDA